MDNTDNNTNNNVNNINPNADNTEKELNQDADINKDGISERKYRKKSSSGFIKGLAAGLFIGLVIAACSVIFANFRYAIRNNDIASTSVARLDYSAINSKLKTIGGLIEDRYLYGTDAETVETGIFKGMMYSIGDLYADYYSPEEFEDETDESNGNYCGIGVLMSYNAADNTITVVEVYENSPAEEAGVMEGDVLKEVNHENITILDFETVVEEYVKGEEGTYVNLTFDRDGEEVNLQVERRQVEITTVKSSELSLENGEKLGYINISSFEKATVNQFRAAMDKFDTDEFSGIIVDLRDNPGGVMESAVIMADYILPDDISTYSDNETDGEYRGRTLLLYTENKKGRDSAYYSSDEHSTDKDIVILVNGNTASSSEIFTGALKDYSMARVVGTKTYGKGIVQSIIPLADGSAVKFTTNSYYTPSGSEIHGVGISPDVECEADDTLLEKGADPSAPSPDIDNQLKAAMKLFEE